MGSQPGSWQDPGLLLARARNGTPGSVQASGMCFKVCETLIRSNNSAQRHSRATGLGCTAPLGPHSDPVKLQGYSRPPEVAKGVSQGNTDAGRSAHALSGRR